MYTHIIKLYNNNNDNYKLASEMEIEQQTFINTTKDRKQFINIIIKSGLINKITDVTLGSVN